MGAKLLEIKNFSLSIYANDGMVSILKGVNLSIEKGESVAISGPSGSGKSMLALSISGLLPRYLNISRQGEISLYDHEHHSIDLICMKHSNWENIRGTKIAMIFQDAMSAFNPLQTCGDQIAEVLRFKLRIKRSEARSQTLSLMKDLGLNPNDALFQSYPHQLSGGQLQRMMIAMALIGKPELIIADEPASNLDEQNKAELIDLLKKMHQESGAALIYITHDQDEAAKVADRLLVLNDGQLEQLPSSQIISMPDNKLLQNGPSADVNMISDSENENFLPLMSISNVSKQFARKSFWGKTKAVTPVLNRVNLQIFRGETIGLLGPSGSGKSTLGRLILNLENPDSGEIFYKNSNLSELTGTQLKELRKKIQVVYQNPYNTLNPRMTVLSIVREPLAVHGLLQNRAERNKRAAELLLLCGISKEKHKHYTYQLSGGQRQRVAIARAMILEPAFVVLDECVSSLDGFTKDNILELLNDFKTRTQVSYLFIAHDKHLVERFADRIFVLQDGKLLPHLGQEIPIH